MSGSVGLWPNNAFGSEKSPLGRSPGQHRVTGITTIYPWEAEARAAAAPNGELPLATVPPATVPLTDASRLASEASRFNGAQPVPGAARVAASASVPLPGMGEQPRPDGAQKKFARRAALPSSDSGTWGVNPVAHPERALVEVLVRGGVAGLGVVLETGAVLTSLASIGQGLELSLRFVDGSVEPASVRRTHRAYDLALLEPLGHKVRLGLPLARALVQPLTLLERRALGDRGAGLTAPLSVEAYRKVTVSWFGAVWGADGVPIAGAIRPPPGLTDLGSALITSSGHLGALVTLACVSPLERAGKGPEGCRVTRVGLGSSALGEFLEILEPDSTNVWFGVVGETTDTGWARGVRVTGVKPGSLSAYAGLRAHTEATAGDVIVAIDDVPVHSLEQLKSVLQRRQPGARLQVTVLRDGRIIHLPLPQQRWQHSLSGDKQPSVTF